MRTRLGAAARDRALTELTASSAVDRHVDLYRSLVAKQRPN
jgi:hypothetical protein